MQTRRIFAHVALGGKDGGFPASYIMLSKRFLSVSLVHKLHKAETLFLSGLLVRDLTNTHASQSDHFLWS